MRLQAVLFLAIMSTPSAAIDSLEVRDCCGACIGAVLAGKPLNALEDVPRLAEVSDLLFVGKVTRSEIDPCCDGWADGAFRVKKRWKGPSEKLVTVRTGGSCAEPFPFAIGREYLVSATAPSQYDGHRYVFYAFTPLEGSAAGRHIFALDEWERSKADTDSHQEKP